VRRLASLALLLALVAIAASGCTSSRPYDHSTVEPVPTKIVGKAPKVTTASTAVPAEYKGGDPVAGKHIFQTGPCAGCHTLADAGTHGTVGPNLDQAKPSLSLAIDRLTNGAGAMPSFKGQLSTKQIADVAAYVVKATGGNPNG
jgi:mono/diheme cytochrome c family protein